MKFLTAAILLTVVMMVLFFAGLVTANPVATMAGTCLFGLIANPMLWVAIYRVGTQFSRKYQVVPRRG